MNTCANRLDGDIRTIEVVFLKDIDVCLDLNITLSVVSSGVIGNGINEITSVNHTGER